MFYLLSPQKFNCQTVKQSTVQPSTANRPTVNNLTANGSTANRVTANCHISRHSTVNRLTAKRLRFSVIFNFRVFLFFSVLRVRKNERENTRMKCISRRHRDFHSFSL